MNKNTAPELWSALFRGREVDGFDEVHVKGDTSLLLNDTRHPRVVIIGTRDISPYGQMMTREVVSALAKNPRKPVVVSGLAVGVDAVAHEEALKRGLPTVAVLPTGLDTVYPFVHTVLAGKISHAEGACLLTPFPVGTEPGAVNFLRRNKVMAAMADVIIVVESKKRGGAMLTAGFAAGHDNVRIYAVPGRLTDTRSEGCLELIYDDMAKPLVRTDIFENERFFDFVNY